MSNRNETFCTHVGCMDGRVQEVVARYAKEKFCVQFVDTITEPGVDGLLAKADSESDLYKSVKLKIEISTNNHHSCGIIVEGHEECAGNPSDRQQHLKDIRESVEKIKEMVGGSLTVQGVYVTLRPESRVEEV
ncbi:MAG: hypothetical protein A2857_07005 [Candidatus Levybacteria bacterium RIFCSPHIGHO2_01_FULL_36_15]|nr:MAG: hypothetical protein A2857_07005 [Candidatus Levybacteria bacterium RIFCSPHIGHO2_01_FULL_36_15]